MNNNTIALASGAAFLEKSGYRPLTISNNTITEASSSVIIRVATGTSTSITDNHISGTVSAFESGAITQAGATATSVAYNTIELELNGCANPYNAIWIESGTMTVAHNNISVACQGTDQIEPSVGVVNAGESVVSVDHNNIDVTHADSANTTFHLRVFNDGVIEASNNHYSGTNETSPSLNENNDGEINQDVSDDVALAWPTTFGSAGCVGHLCN